MKPRDRQNETNVQRGTEFVDTTRRVLTFALGVPLDVEVPIGIGDPPKPHRFDLANSQHRIAIECKAFTWTRGDNIPSAKITTVREALLYLQWLPARWTKAVAMMRSTRATHDESLAEYFVRLNAHLLGDVSVLEVGESSVRVLAGRIPE